MSKLVLDAMVRQKYDDNRDEMSKLRQEILERVQKEFAVEAKTFHEENEKLRALDLKFRKDVEPLVKRAWTNGLKVKVWSQVGKNSSIVREYTGNIVNVSNSSTGGINMIDFQETDRNKFSIGISCFMGIELLEDDNTAGS